jgi:hypothetical protein
MKEHNWRPVSASHPVDSTPTLHDRSVPDQMIVFFQASRFRPARSRPHISRVRRHGRCSCYVGMNFFNCGLPKVSRSPLRGEPKIAAESGWIDRIVAPTTPSVRSRMLYPSSLFAMTTRWIWLVLSYIWVFSQIGPASDTQSADLAPLGSPWRPVDPVVPSSWDEVGMTDVMRVSAVARRLPINP